METYDLNNVLETLNTISQDNNCQEICCICQDILDNGEQIYELPECNHMYHTNCIMTWFRAQNIACPYCANPGTLNEKPTPRRSYGYYGGYNNALRLMETNRYKMIIKILNKKDVPKDLKKLHATLKTSLSIYTNLRKDISEFKKNVKKQLTYENAIKQTESQLRKIRTLGLKINKTVQNIIDYPIVPIIIPFR